MNVMPIVARLVLFERQRFASAEERRIARDALDAILADRLAVFIGGMRGAFVKVAQVLGSLEPAPVRPAYVAKLEPMVDSAPGGRPWRRVRPQLERELRRTGHRGGVDAVFSEFDKEPIGVASVGQVHRAVLRSSGRVVAVKLQYPDARSLILADLGNIHNLLRFLGKKAEAGVVREYRSRMSQEFDYLQEGRTMNTVAAYFNSSSAVVVPRCVDGFSTRHLLVMDFLEGRSLRDTLRSRYAAALRYPAPIRLPLLLSLRTSAKRKLGTLLRAQAQQIFSLGTFNADPHPGNILLTPGDDRLGLLDFGCSKTLNRTQRASLARLYVALAARDDEAIAAAAVEMGVRTKHMNKTVIVQFASHFFDRNIADVGPHIFLLELNRIDRITSLPKDYMLVARSSLLLRGVGAKLHAPQQVARAWEPEARRYLERLEEDGDIG